MLYTSNNFFKKRIQQSCQCKRSLGDEGLDCAQNRYQCFVNKDYNKITDIEPLRELTGLRRLMGVDNKVKSLEPLRNLTQLKTI